MFENFDLKLKHLFSPIAVVIITLAHYGFRGLAIRVDLIENSALYSRDG